MNRRNFFASLATGLAAAPTVVKAVCDGPVFTYRKVSEYRAATPQDLSRLMADETRRMHEAVCRHIVENDPYASLLR